jgi:hypothetical protein
MGWSFHPRSFAGKAGPLLTLRKETQMKTVAIWCSVAVVASAFGLASAQDDWPGTLQFGTARADTAFGLAADPTGNLYVAGLTNGDLDGGNRSGKPDAYLIKLGAAGNRLWTRQVGTASAGDEAINVALDGSGNAYLVGLTNGALEGQSNAGDYDAFLLKYAADGRELWRTQFGTREDDSPIGKGLAVDKEGNAYVVGASRLRLDGSATAGGRDGYVVKFAPDGRRLWTRHIGGSSDDLVFGAAIAPGGAVHVAGLTSGILAEGSMPGGGDAFVARLGSDGELHWLRQFGSPGADTAFAVTVDPRGNTYVTGSSGGSFVKVPNAERGGAYLAGLDAQGNLSWLHAFGPEGSVVSTDLALDSRGAVLVTGFLQGSLDGLGDTGRADAFLLKVTPGGARRWTRRLGTPGTDQAFAIAVNAADQVFIAGGTEAEIAGTPGLGNADIFTASFSPEGSERMGGPRSTDGRPAALLLTGRIEGWASGPGGIYLGGWLDGTTLSRGSIDADGTFRVALPSSGTWAGEPIFRPASECFTGEGSLEASTESLEIARNWYLGSFPVGVFDPETLKVRAFAGRATWDVTQERYPTGPTEWGAVFLYARGSGRLRGSCTETGRNGTTLHEIDVDLHSGWNTLSVTRRPDGRLLYRSTALPASVGWRFWAP